MGGKCKNTVDISLTVWCAEWYSAVTCGAREIINIYFNILLLQVAYESCETWLAILDPDFSVTHIE